ncbi:MAG: EFR1 family ferrodoxin [Fibrobacterota bacterium]
MMNRLYYFSGTGNTLHLAQRIAQNLGECELVPIPKALQQDRIYEDAERVGVLFPVYCFGYPLIVGRFLERLQLSEKTWFFGASTYGGLLADAMELFRKKSAREGLKAEAGFALHMPGNAIFLYDRVSQEKQKTMTENLERRLPKIVETIEQKQAAPMEQVSFPFNKLLSLLYPPFIKKIPEGAHSFYATEACTACGICENICPVHNISRPEGHPVWGAQCEQCMACIQWCPANAIQMGKKTIKRSRYHHPAVTSEDIAAQS